MDTFEWWSNRIRRVHSTEYVTFLLLTRFPLDTLFASEHRHPLVLLTHIPLSRPETASCGPLRERGTIRRGVGRGYQSTLGKQTSVFLLETLQPTAIFRCES